MIAKHSGFERVTNPEEIEFIRKRELDPARLSGKEKMYAYYQMMGMDVEYEDIFNFVEI